MMTLKQIVGIMGCSNSTAIKHMKHAGINPEERSAARTGGRIFYYDITPEQVMEIKERRAKQPRQAIAEQGCALSALEMAFNSSRSLKLGNYIKAG